MPGSIRILGHPASDTVGVRSSVAKKDTTTQ